MAYKTFTIKNISVVNNIATSAADNEVMFIIRVTNDFNCTDCDAQVIDNGLRNLFDVYLAEDCDCHCEPGFELNDAGECDGESWEPAENNCACLDTNNNITGSLDEISCTDAGNLWVCNWTAKTTQQQAPLIYNQVGWGTGGAIIYSEFYPAAPTNNLGLSTNDLPFDRWQNLGSITQIPAGAKVFVDTGNSGAFQYLYANPATFNNNNALFTNRLKDIGIWAEGVNLYTSMSDSWIPVNDWIGITTCLTVTQPSVYYVALAAADDFRFSIDGNVIIQAGANQGILNLNADYWNLFPIGLVPGKYTLTFEGKNILNAGPAAFAFEMYPYDLGSVPTQNLLGDAGLTAVSNTIGFSGGLVGLEDIVVLDDNNVPISSKSYINQSMNTGSIVGDYCPAGYFTNCFDAKLCKVEITGEDCELPINCPEYLDSIVGCIGDIGTLVYNRLAGGIMEGGEAYREDLANMWRVILIKYLFKNSYTCLSQENLLSFGQFLNKICPDCLSRVKTYKDVNYISDPGDSNTGITGLNQTPDVNTFDF